MPESESSTCWIAVKHSLPIGGDVRVINLARRLDLGGGETAVEQRLSERRAERPDRIARTELGCEWIAGIADEAGKRYGWKIPGELDANLGIGLAHGLLRRRNVGPAL